MICGDYLMILYCRRMGLVYGEKGLLELYKIL